jgi:hypothetical protein
MLTVITIILACSIAISQCTVTSAERFAQIESPRAGGCEIAAMEWAATTGFLHEGETLKIICRDGERT